MHLNDLQPAAGSKRRRKRLGRGIGSGSGKTAGRGHKGQKARAGGYHKIGFEGGQMPLQRRLPKFGFVSRRPKTTVAIRLTELAACGTDEIDLAKLKSAGILGKTVKRVKVIASGSIGRPVTLKGIEVTDGARRAIETAGGKVEP
jgi:large subunit ribosomal protein L15